MIANDDLQAIFNRSGTAKGRVGFHTAFEKTMGPRRHEQIRILEIGIHYGYSLQAWLDWCPKAEVTGMDTFERLQPESVPVLQNPRVNWHRRNSTDRVPARFGTFDFIIDDGCHWHAAQRTTFSRYWPQLKAGGSYFIEDVWPFDLLTDEDKQHPWLLEYPGCWSDEQYDALLETISVGDVHHHDFRGIEGLINSDHYILEIRKP